MGSSSCAGIRSSLDPHNGQLKHKLLFGSDFPLIAPDRWIKDFKDAGFEPEVRAT